MQRNYDIFYEELKLSCYQPQVTHLCITFRASMVYNQCATPPAYDYPQCALHAKTVQLRVVRTHKLSTNLRAPYKQLAYH